MSYSYTSRNSNRPRPGRSSFGSHSSGPRRSGGGNHKQYINPALFVRAAKPQTAETTYVPKYTFSDFACQSLIKTNLTNNGILIPTPIQDQAIPEGLAGKDIIGIANTGTGKTIAFAVPVLDRLMRGDDSRVLIMAPTRELAQQIESECRMIARGSGLKGAVLIGGSSMTQQLRDLKTRPQIVVGTPGRIKDHMERGSLDLSRFNLVVLDEVDRMLDMGFINDMQFILAKLATPRQSFFFSATMDASVQKLTGAFLTDPITISVKTGETSDNVAQDVITFNSPRDKMDKLHDILLSKEMSKALIFDETQRRVERLHEELQTLGFKVEAIHGGKSQGQRQRALQRFKNSEVQFLVATDVAARGIDIADITHVINFSTPQSYQDYTHRVGRAGRAGRAGFAYTFIEG